MRKYFVNIQSRKIVSMFHQFSSETLIISVNKGTGSIHPPCYEHNVVATVLIYRCVNVNISLRQCEYIVVAV